MEDYDLDCDWEQLAAKQEKLDLESLEEGDVWALEDRNNFAHDWPGRRVFVLVDDVDQDRVIVFDELGALINEPTDGVCQGVQQVSSVSVCSPRCGRNGE